MTFVEFEYLKLKLDSPLCLLSNFPLQNLWAKVKLKIFKPKIFLETPAD